MKNKFYLLSVIVAAFVIENAYAQTHNGHAYVDLSLPSGTMWATCNVGASNPKDYGDYFAWGETKPKGTYYADNYKYCKFTEDEAYLTKYCNSSEKGYNGFTDLFTNLQESDDVATANWGKGWCTPTKEQWGELIDYCGWIWVNGFYEVEGPNGKSIIIPASGHYEGYGVVLDGPDGYYWSSSISDDNSFRSSYFYFREGYGSIHTTDRYFGLSVRPVKAVKQEQKTISLIGTKWKWGDEYEWDEEELGENDSKYYEVSVYIEFISEQKLYYESDWGPYGGNAEYYYYSFDGEKGKIFDDEKLTFIVELDEKGLPSTLILEGKHIGKLTLRQVTK